MVTGVEGGLTSKPMTRAFGYAEATSYAQSPCPVPMSKMTPLPLKGAQWFALRELLRT